MSKGKLNKETRKDLKNEIESLLSNISSEPVEDLLIDNDLSNELQRESKHDFEEMSDKFTQKAKNITDSLFKNFVDIGIFEKNDYARHKKELDTINISNLFFQLKTLKNNGDEDNGRDFCGKYSSPIIRSNGTATR